MSEEQVLSAAIRNRIENIEIEFHSGRIKIQMQIGGTLSVRVEEKNESEMECQSETPSHSGLNTSESRI